MGIRSRLFLTDGQRVSIRSHRSRGRDPPPNRGVAQRKDAVRLGWRIRVTDMTVRTNQRTATI